MEHQPRSKVQAFIQYNKKKGTKILLVDTNSNMEDEKYKW